MDESYKDMLKKQAYGFAGETTAVKICSWTKNAILDNGVCYKEKFYGIRCHMCCQMSPACNTCNLNCIFCWRDRYESPFDKVDDPEKIIDNCIKEQNKLLTGFGGNDKANKKKFEESKDAAHFAISLTGEPTAYPKLGDFIKNLHKRNKSTFLVTNGMFPNVLEKLERENALPTQLYISLDGPNEKLFKEIDRPNPDLKEPWNKLMQTMDLLNKFGKEKSTRTTIRITLVKHYNMVNPEQWAEVIKRANPLFLEVKGYSWVGTSRQRLLLSDAPRHEEVKAFAEEIGKHCGYKYIDDQDRSRVVLMMKEDIPGRIMTWN